MIAQRWLSAAGLASLTILGMTTPLSAEVVFTVVMSDIGANWPFTPPSSGAQVKVPLYPSGAFSTSQFANKANQRFIVTFTAECTVVAPDGTSFPWMDLDIVAINQSTQAETVLPPTDGSQDAFCGANGTANEDGFSMHTVNAVSTTLPAGNYRIQVRARLTPDATYGWLGERTLIVWR